MLVYLTDLMGETSDAPTFPVVWALPPGLPEPNVKWGLVLKLD